MEIADIAMELDDLSEELNLPRLAELAEALSEHVYLPGAEVGAGLIEATNLSAGTVTLGPGSLTVHNAALSTALSSSTTINPNAIAAKVI